MWCSRMSFEKKYEVDLSSKEQKLAALRANADAFHALGGIPLMLTEHVENGIDAIKDRPRVEGLNKSFPKGQVEIIIDEHKSEVRIIDNGTGVLDPIWVMTHPLKSLKTGIDYQTGKYGRGLQGFRGFCRTLEYITFRSKPSQAEMNDIKKAIYAGEISKNIDARCVRVSLTASEVEGKLKTESIQEFRKYSQHTTGTVAILKDWLAGEFEELLRNKQKLVDRIQHHFGFEIGAGTLSITAKHGNKVNVMQPRDFSNYDLFDLPDIEVINQYTKEKYGKIEFYLYKTSGADKHPYKAPFVLIRGRPLQDALKNMEEFKDDKIWSSPYITGYIKCDFIDPNALRIAIEPGEKRKWFIMHVRNAAMDLRPLLEEYQAGFNKHERSAENQKIVWEIQSFLRKQKIKLDFDFSKLGALAPQFNTGTKAGERISSIEGTTNQGRITSKGTVQTVLLYQKNPYNGSIKPTKKKRIAVTINRDPKNVRDPKKHGRAQKTVYIDPKLLSKDGRVKKTTLTGPGIESVFEELNKETLSYYDEFKACVMINEAHEVFTEMERMHKGSAQSADSVYSQKQKNFIRERYLWEIIANCIKNKSREEVENLFWNLYHEFFLHKDTT